jgi:hypothetical protein
MRNTLILTALISTLFSCTKEKHISTADFTVDNEVVYLGQPVTAKATDKGGNTDYKFDFGDGSTVTTSGPSVSHEYSQPGQYTIRLLIYGKAFTKEIRVLPGILSYQIKNSTSRELNILSYVDNGQSGTLYRTNYYADKLGDTLYSSHGSLGPGLHIIGVSVFLNNNEYAMYDFVQREWRTHTIIEINDSTRVVPRTWSGSGTAPIYYLKDL